MNRPVDGASREQWIEWIEHLGGQVKNHVTKQTSLVIVGDNAGRTKIAEAKAKGIPTVSWMMIDEFGLFEKRGSYRLSIPHEFFQQLIITTLTTLEEILTYAIRIGEPRFYRSFEAGSRFLTHLLQVAYDSASPSADSSSEGIGGAD